MIEDNTIIINAQTGEVTETYIEPIEIPQYVPTQADYEMLVESKIRERYTTSEEFAILRQKDEKSDEWLGYYEYCEQCKVEAKKELQL